MTFKKGQSGNPKGKPPGPNKKTTEFRETVRALLERNSENVATWLEAVAKDDPYKALSLLCSLAEYAAPKLARNELTGLDGGAIKTQALEVAYVSAPDSTQAVQTLQ